MIFPSFLLAATLLLPLAAFAVPVGLRPGNARNEAILARTYVDSPLPTFKVPGNPHPPQEPPINARAVALEAREDVPFTRLPNTHLDPLNARTYVDSPLPTIKVPGHPHPSEPPVNARDIPF